MTTKHTKPDDQLKTYRDAVWDYLLEHCDITQNGSFFVKFHTRDRATFEKHVFARWKYGYHRVDDRMNFTHKQKEIDANARRKAHSDRKKAKQRKWMLTLAEQKAAHKRLERQKWLKSKPALYLIHTHLMQPVATLWYNMVNYVKTIVHNKKEK